MISDISEAGMHALEMREGVRLTAYPDVVGVWTIGVGHTGLVDGKPIKRGMKITQAKCDQLFREDLIDFETAVIEAVSVELTQNQFDALVSFAFNIGVGGFKKSTVLRRLNAKDYKGAAEALLMWNKPAAIIGRRQSERKQFLTPDVPGKVLSTTTKVIAPVTATPVATPTLWQRWKKWIS